MKKWKRIKAGRRKTGIREKKKRKRKGKKRKKRKEKKITESTAMKKRRTTHEQRRREKGDETNIERIIFLFVLLIFGLQKRGKKDTRTKEKIAGLYCRSSLIFSYFP